MSALSNRRQNVSASRSPDYERKRTEILDVAAHVFRELGFGAASVDEIAKRLGLDRATLYYYFAGKKEMFREMVSRATVGNVEAAEAIAYSSSHSSDKLRRLILELFRSYERHYPYLYVYLGEDINRLANDKTVWSKNVQALNHRFDVAVTCIIREGQKSGELRVPGDPKIVVAGILGMCNWSHRWFKLNGKLTGEEIANTFTDMVLNGLSA